MRRLALLASLVLIATACSDDDGAVTTVTDTAPVTTAPATTTAPDTTPATTTTAAPATSAAATTTTAEATTTAADPSAEVIAAALEVVGDYGGEWENTTFGSTGSVAASIAVDPDAGTMSVTLDLGGFVFGLSDPDPETIVLDLRSPLPFEFTSALLGDATMFISGDRQRLTVDALDVPAPGIQSMRVEVVATEEDVISMVYFIEFEDGGGEARGTVEIDAGA